jgi:NAD(P)H-hydrate epimerase
VLPRRPLDAHKGTFGTALIVAGSANYTGAAWLAGQAAYRVGAGLVTLAVPTPLHAALAGQFPEATWVLLPHSDGFIAAQASATLQPHLERATALLVGPGFGLEETTKEFLERLLGDKETGVPPMVVDADALKLLRRLPDWNKRLPAPAVLTPHPGEMAVLTGLSKEAIRADRLGLACHYSQEWGHVVVLKGAFTVIAAPDGATAIIPVANPALVRAGTGDVLAGLIAGLRAQGVGAFKAAVAGAWIHAYAGLQAVEEVGNPASVLAGDVLRATIAVISDVLT